MNIILCSTPLQVLIAERIRALYPDESFYGVMNSYVFSDKHAHYYERLGQFCDKTLLILDQEGRSQLEIYRETLSRLILGYRLPRMKRIFIASLDLSTFHLLLSRQGSAEVITFDDGLINLSPNAYKQIAFKKLGSMQRLLRVWGVPSPVDLIARQHLHYSIYDLPNVLPNAQRIEWLPKGENTSTPPSEVITLFLGQPIYEYEANGESRNIALSARMVQRYEVQQYYPHPREQYQIEGVEYVHSPLIFEDYILQELARYPERTYRIYGFCSSVILNLQGIDRLEFIAIRPADCPEFLEETYQLLERCGIPIEHIS